MEAQPPQSSTTPIAEIGSLARAVEAERAGRYVAAWQEALKVIALRPFHPEAYIQMASTAVAAGDPEALKAFGVFGSGVHQHVKKRPEIINSKITSDFLC